MRAPSRSARARRSLQRGRHRRVLAFERRTSKQNLIQGWIAEQLAEMKKVSWCYEPCRHHTIEPENQISDYDTDILLWSEHQAELLRRHAAGERVNDAALDWPNIVEEIEGEG